MPPRGATERAPLARRPRRARAPPERLDGRALRADDALPELAAAPLYLVVERTRHAAGAADHDETDAELLAPPVDEAGRRLVEQVVLALDVWHQELLVAREAAAARRGLVERLFLALHVWHQELLIAREAAAARRGHLARELTLGAARPLGLLALCLAPRLLLEPRAAHDHD